MTFKSWISLTLTMYITMNLLPTKHQLNESMYHIIFFLYNDWKRTCWRRDHISKHKRPRLLKHFQVYRLSVLQRHKVWRKYYLYMYLFYLWTWVVSPVVVRTENIRTYHSCGLGKKNLLNFVSTIDQIPTLGVWLPGRVSNGFWWIRFSSKVTIKQNRFFFSNAYILTIKWDSSLHQYTDERSRTGVVISLH